MTTDPSASGPPPLDSLPALQKVTISSAPAPIFATVSSLPKPNPATDPTTRLGVRTRPVDLADVNWPLVYRIRRTLSERLANETVAAAGTEVTEEDRRELGRDLLWGVIREHHDEAVLAGDSANQIPTHLHSTYHRAADSAIFGYGRWQPLMDDPDMENLEIRGHDKVFMIYSDRIERVAPVADSPEELIEQLQFIATYSKTPKPFSSANPKMTLNLEDRYRLWAQAFDVVDRPNIVIRQHKFPGITLDQLAGWGMMPRHVADFLAAAVRSNQSMVISGIGGVGKTTFLRALAMSMDPNESVAVVETDAELFLHKLPGRDRIVNHVARGGTGEGFGGDGRPIGEFSVHEHLVESLRGNYKRVVVGEVRDSEAATMFQAMQYGAGSLSTIHAKHAAATIERLVTAAATGGILTQTDAYRQIAVNIDLIIHLDAIDNRSTGGSYQRFVNQIIEIDGFKDQANGVTFLPATAEIYQHPQHNRPLDLTMSSHLRNDLIRNGWTGEAP